MSLILFLVLDIFFILCWSLKSPPICPNFFFYLLFYKIYISLFNPRFVHNFLPNSCLSFAFDNLFVCPFLSVIMSLYVDVFFKQLRRLWYLKCKENIFKKKSFWLLYFVLLCWLEGTARYAGLLQSPADGFGLRPSLFLPLGLKKDFLCCLGLFKAFFGV